MSAKQYNDYLVQCFIDGVSQEIQAGLRYQFKSPNTENSLELYAAFLRKADKKSIHVGEVSLPFLTCSGVQVIPVLHDCDGEGFTENYISFLRDEVASRSGIFEHSALLIIHNSMLDTLINSALDVGADGSIWSPDSIAAVLRQQINESGSSNRALYDCLLDDQLELIVEEGATVFGFSPLFSAIVDGSLDLNTFGLFNDPIILNMVGQKEQVRRRLDENRNLYNRIEYDIEHYADQLERTLDDFSQKFIKEHFEDLNDWESLDFESYLDESKANKIQKLLFESAEIADADLYQRAKSQTKAGLKELSLLFQISQNQTSIDLVLTFLGNDLKEEQLKIRPTSIKASVEVSRLGGKRCKAKIQLPFTGEPTFISIDLKRENRTEEYKFRCLLVEKDRFYIEEVKNCFRIDSNNNWMTILLEGNQLRIKPDGDDVYALTENGFNNVNVDDYNLVDFEDVADQTEIIQFTVCSGQQKLLLNIEGPAAEDSVNIPLLFDQERFLKLLSDDYNAEYNRLKNKIIIDNSESLVVGVRQNLLAFESHMVSNRLLYVTDFDQLSIDDIQTFSSDLYQSYDSLFKYLEQYKTLPSLVAWGGGFCAIVQSLLDAYEAYLLSIPLNDVLKNEHKQILKIGIHKQAGKERISPIHPLVLAYYLQLVRDIRNDKDGEEGKSSFTKLPSVTLDRLVPSGLLPFVYHQESNFAHVVPVKENTFWLEIVPQKQVSYNYVKRLVRDKLAEFTQAYARLFSVGSRSTLIINFINQGVAAELFLGLMEYFKERKEKAFSIHVNFYDDILVRNDFDRFSETSSYDELKSWLTINSGAFRGEADVLIDIIRSRLTYSKFTTPKENEALAYAHLAFFRNNLPVDCRSININEALSGVLCGGLIAGEASEIKGGAYFTSFGLRQVDTHNSQSLRLAALLGNLWQSSQQANTPYLGNGIGLAVSTDFEDLLGRSYDSALWTTIIDPKVTLDFFTTQKDVVLIHYSDQYTTSAGYDAITVTKQVDLFKRLLYKESGSSAADNLLSEFNAFNGEWLLKMLTAQPKDRKEKNGIIGAYKFVSALLRQSDINWIPLSVAEIIRVSGNVGLKMSDSEFSRHVHGYRKGAISDDVLFVGFKGDTLYLLPLEVKTGARPDYVYAGKQAKELKRYLMEEVLQPKTLASRLYRGLFIRQVLMQVEKFQLYQMVTNDKLDALLSRREWWLNGEYHVSSVPNYVDGFVLAHVENDTCFESSYNLNNDNILQIELPYALLPSLIAVNSADDNALVELVKTCKINPEYVLQPSTISTVNEIATAKPSTILNEELQPSAVVVPVVENKPLQVLFGHDAFTKVPFYWEPTNTAKFMNTNTGIIGTMGTGKTQFTKSVITQLMLNQSCNVNSEPIGILIFDYKSDYVDDAFIQANGAKPYKLQGLPYNPLSLYGNMPMLPVHTATSFAETMAVAFGLGQKQQLKLRKLILDAYELAGISKSDSSTWHKPAPTIAQIWDLFLDQEKVEQDSLYAALDSLATFEIFESKPEHVTSLYELINGVVVIELASYTPQIQNLVVALTLDLFYSQMQKKGKPTVQGDYRQITKMILVDEADNFMSQDFPSLRKILKEGREYGVGVILSTQDITHFKTGDNNYSSYVLTWVIHRVSEIRNSDIKAIFNKDDKSEQEPLMETIRKLDKHYSLYIDGNKQVKKMRDRAFWELKEANND